MVGGNIVGGNLVVVTPMKVASLFSRGRDDQSRASGRTSETAWRRRHLLCCLEGPDRTASLKISGSKPQLGQELSASGDLQVEWGARQLFPALI